MPLKRQTCLKQSRQDVILSMCICKNDIEKLQLKKTFKALTIKHQLKSKFHKVRNPKPNFETEFHKLLEK